MKLSQTWHYFKKRVLQLYRKMNTFCSNPFRQNWGTAIYSRNLSLKEVKIDTYSGRIVAAKVPHSYEEITVVSIHAPIIGGRVFPYLDEIFDEIEEILAGHTFIVGRDLNTARLAEKVWPGHGHGSFFERLAESMFFDCHWKFQHGEQQTFFRSGVKHPFQDDHLFVSYNLAKRVTSCDVLNNESIRGVSDHIPVYAEIDL